MILWLGAGMATFLTMCVSIPINIAFLSLLYKEKLFQEWITKQAKRVIFLNIQQLATTVGKTAAVLITYIITGPAMVGTPLVWLFDISRKRAYALVVVGLTLNALVWVGGIYNLAWIIIRAVFLE